MNADAVPTRRPRSSIFATSRNGTDPRTASAWTRRQVAENNARALVGRAFPRVRGMSREPSWLFFEILLPFLTTSAFVFVYRTLQAPEAYVGFVVLGGAMAAFWLNVVWMMAAQLYWEKDQGNLELYFAAPMNLMSVLLGMAVGGLIMSSVRAVAILVVSTFVFGVTFDVQQWGLVIAVFLLTLSALYGLGMAMASLYLLWGREAFHMTNVMIEPVYFVSGPELPGRQARRAGRRRHRDDPVRRRPRRAASARVHRPAVHHGHAAARGGGTDPGRDDRGVHPARALADPAHRADGPGARHPLPALAMSAVTSDGLAGSPATFDRRRAEGGGAGDAARNLRTALLLGWRVESNWTDPVLFSIYTVARPIASLLLLVAMVTIIGGSADQQVRTFVILGSALWAMLVAGLSGPAWSVLEDRERYRMLKYLYVSPATFLLLLVGRGGARLGAGAMGTAVALLFAVVVLGLRVDLATVSWPLLVVCLAVGIVPIIGLGIFLAAICLQTRQESWSYPDAFAGALFLISGVVFPLSALPPLLQVFGLLNPITWWVAGVRLAIVPDGPSSIGGPNSVWTAVTGTAAPDATTIVIALCLTGALATLAAIATFRSSERRARDLGLLDRTTGS